MLLLTLSEKGNGETFGVRIVDRERLHFYVVVHHRALAWNMGISRQLGLVDVYSDV